MSGIASADRVLFALSILGYIVLLIRLWISGLTGVYRVFSLYVSFQLVRSAFMYSLPFLGSSRNLYGWTFALTEAVVWVLNVLVVFELQRLTVEKYPGISTAGRRFLSAGLGISVIVSLATLVPEMSAGPAKFSRLLYFMTVGRGIASMLAVFLVLLTGFMSWFPIPVPRNVIVHLVLFFTYFVSKNIGLLARNVAGAGAPKLAGLAFQAAACVCLLGWVVALNRRGESVRKTLIPRSRPEDAERLVGQLEALNATLSRNKRC